MILQPAGVLPRYLARTSPRTPSEILFEDLSPRVERRVQVLVLLYRTPPGDPVKKPMVHAPCRGEGGGPCALVTLVYPLSDREGKARCGSRQRPPRRGEKFVTFQCCGGVLRPQTLTNSTQFLRDKALYHVEVTTLHWNPFLSVGGEREDLQKLEIFLERSRVEDSICGRSVYFSLARSTGREAVCRCLGGIARTTRVDQRSP